MTAIAYRAGIIAADSRTTTDNDWCEPCDKLFRKRVGKRDVVIGTAGHDHLGMVFVDWFGQMEKEPPSILRDAHLEEDFEVLVLDRGKAYKANHLCRLIEVKGPFTAIGSGGAVAMAAMICGKSAREAVAVACKLDPYCAPPIVTMHMPGSSRHKGL